MVFVIVVGLALLALAMLVMAGIYAMSKAISTVQRGDY